MKDFLVLVRNLVLKTGYKVLVKPIFFLMDPETAHFKAMRSGKRLGKLKIGRKITSLLFGYENEILNQEILGVKFKNPVGLSAGFDKNAELTEILPSLGFGFAEVGTITGEPCQGNAKPRLWRLKKSKSLLVNWGLMNDGCEAVKKRLENKSFEIPIIVSVGKTNCQETADTEAGIKDYCKAYSFLNDVGVATDINISCPNAYGGEPFTDPEKLRKLLTSINEIRGKNPIFLKMPSDLPEDGIRKIVEVALEFNLDGVICTNLTKDRNNPKLYEKEIPNVGGISGKAVEDKADKVISQVYKLAKGKLVIIGVGGISSADDAYKKIRLGADLIELITGMIMEGPQVISEINLGLVKLLKRDGFKSISEAVGIDVKTEQP